MVSVPACGVWKREASEVGSIPASHLLLRRKVMATCPGTALFLHKAAVLGALSA